jgi:GTPase SAR1 family protein
MRLRRIRKKIKVFLIRTSRMFTGGVYGKRISKSKQERMLLKIVRTLLNTPDSKVYCLPASSRVYIHPKDRKYIIVFDYDGIKISNHRFFFNTSIKYRIGEEMVNAAKDRMERDLLKLNQEISYNEENFLSEVYSNFKRTRERSVSPTMDPIHKILTDI